MDFDLKAFCEEARSWEGTPYVPGARVKGVGTDCGGILYELYNPIFGPFPLFPQLPPDWALHDRTEHYLDFVRPFAVQVRFVRPGGFSLYHMGLVYAHAAIFLDDGYYIHSWGRMREGHVTRTMPRVMDTFEKKSGFKALHFMPKGV